MRIQHNIPAMSAYRNYTANVSAVNKNLEKLSSGYRINRAGDDAAGLAISEKMRLQISGLEQAQNNAKSGINLVQTAEGALTEVHDMLNRMYTLAEQSANGTYSDEVDREQLQKEVNSLRTEINRIADATNYNGINLLDGSLDGGTHVTTEAGKFQIGGTGVGALPAVGDDLNTDANTVLHKGSSSSEAVNAFGVEFHNAKIEGDKDDTFTLTIGDVELTGTLTGTAQGDTAITAADLIDALAGDGSAKFTLKVGADDYNKDEIEINGGKFAVAESGTGKGVTFTQTDEADVTGVAMDVTLEVGEDQEPAGEAPTVTPTAGEDAKEAGFTAGTPGTETVTMGGTGANQQWSTSKDTAIGTNLGNLTITAEIDGTTYTTTFKTGATATDGTETDVAATDTYEQALGKAIASLNKQIEAANQTGAGGTTTYTEYGELTLGTLADGKVDVEDIEATEQTYAAATTATKGKLEVDFTGKTAADTIGSSITIDGKTYEFVAAEADAADGNVAVVVAEDADGDAMATALAGAMTGDNVGENVGTVAANTSKVNVEYGTAGADATLDHEESSVENVEVAVSGQWNWKTTDQSVKANAGDELLAQTNFALTKEMAADGASIRIGDDTYTFTTDAAKKDDEGMVYVGDLDLTKADDLATAAQRLTDAAVDNETYTVSQTAGKISLTEVVGYTTGDQKYDLSTKEGIEESLGFTSVKSTVGKGKGLSLQIGDTSEEFNKMTVSIRDMHAVGMGIDKIDISTQEGASAAMDAIKNATNYVSDVRGDLGALQNRLDHTINNLSVTQENIQDAESTIRDVDIAKEMMAYTKNNILVQSAQAMLAQANQLPQGVLQLLG